ncbi:hypothetical protein CJP72_13335, partial [Citrobacter sp. NCU1]|nr:hypothetical protein [Citrobacter sp. NCU1]
MKKTTVGLFGIGLETYWPQFSGLKTQLEGYLAQVDKKISQENVTVINSGLIDNAITMEKATARFTENNIDVLVLYITTYALSSTVLPLGNDSNLLIVFYVQIMPDDFV